MENISETVIKRLPIYYRNVCYMESEGLEKATSSMIAERAGNTGVQVRQDFFMCGGIDDYRIPSLKKRLRELLGICNKHRMVVVGAGNLGRAIISYKDFENEGFFIDAIFDSNLMLEGMQLNGIPIMNIKFFENYLENNDIDIVVIATPADAAEKVFRKAVAGKVRGIWNFAPIDLRSCDEAEVVNVHLSDSLLTLSFRINEKENM